MVKNRTEAQIAARVPVPIKKAMERHVEIDSYVSLSDFIRFALRQRLEEVAPEILEEEINKSMELLEKG